MFRDVKIKDKIWHYATKFFWQPFDLPKQKHPKRTVKKKMWLGYNRRPNSDGHVVGHRCSWLYPNEEDVKAYNSRIQVEIDAEE